VINTFYRVFDWDGQSLSSEVGGPFFVPRSQQSQGRHDVPSVDGVIYASLAPLSAIAETIQFFRNNILTKEHFVKPNGFKKALVTFTMPRELKLQDFDDPKTLVSTNRRVGMVTTRDRTVTQDIARGVFQVGVAGLLWPSALEGLWINATLFESRIEGYAQVKGPIVPLSLKHPDVIKAAQLFGIEIA